MIVCQTNIIISEITIVCTAYGKRTTIIGIIIYKITVYCSTIICCSPIICTVAYECTVYYSRIKYCSPIICTVAYECTVNCINIMSLPVNVQLIAIDPPGSLEYIATLSLSKVQFIAVAFPKIAP